MRALIILAMLFSGTFVLAEQGPKNSQKNSKRAVASSSLKSSSKANCSNNMNITLRADTNPKDSSTKTAGKDNKGQY
jgi:hypothetical protein